MATMKREIPIILFRKVADLGVLNILRSTVPKAVHESIAGRQRIIDSIINMNLEENPEPNAVPKEPNRTISWIHALPFTNCKVRPVPGPSMLLSFSESVRGLAVAILNDRYAI